MNAKLILSAHISRVAHQIASRHSSRVRAAKTIQKRSPQDLSGVGPSPWPELPLEVIYGKAKACRLRQHVNPLRAEFQKPRDAPDWNLIFENSELPLALDIGCAGGRFVLALAHKYQDYNVLGLDIRRPDVQSSWQAIKSLQEMNNHAPKKLIDRANEWARELQLSHRIFFDTANATISLESMLQSYPGNLQLVTIQFPDPHFKKRHKKRRIVQPCLIQALARLMPAEGRVLLQSDVEEVTAAMRDEFEEFGSDFFAPAPEHKWSEAQENAVHKRPAILLNRQQATARRSEHEGSSSPPNQREAYHKSERADVMDNMSRSEESKWPSRVGVHLAIADDHDDRQRQGSRNALQWAKAGYLSANPLNIPTEREVQTLKQSDQVFRFFMVRRSRS